MLRTQNRFIVTVVTERVIFRAQGFGPEMGSPASGTVFLEMYCPKPIARR